MINIIKFMLTINLLVPIFFILKESVNKNKIVINHIMLFSLGFIYYWVIPIFIGNNGWFYERASMDLWYSIFYRVDNQSLLVYLLLILLFYLSFLLGSIFARKFKYKGIKVKMDFTNKALNPIWLFFILLTLPFLYRFRGAFFSGYNLIGVNAQKGSFISLSLIVLSLTLIYLSNLKNNGQFSFKKLIKNKYSGLYITLSLLIISLGTRLYFLTGIIIVLTFYSTFFKKLDFMKTLVIMSLLVIGMGLIGITRGSTADITWSRIMFNIFQEPLYTGYSLIAFLDKSNFEMFQAPIYLLSSFINFLPTFILPNKLDFIHHVSESSYPIFNPLGALNSFTSFMINFGFIGTILFLFIFGFYMEKLRGNDKSPLSMTIYSMVSGFLLTTFFRDGFESSLVKNIFEYSIVFPILIVIFANITTWLLRKNGSSVKM